MSISNRCLSFFQDKTTDNESVSVKESAPFPVDSGGKLYELETYINLSGTEVVSYFFDWHDYALEGFFTLELEVTDGTCLSADIYYRNGAWSESVQGYVETINSTDVEIDTALALGTPDSGIASYNLNTVISAEADKNNDMLRGFFIKINGDASTYATIRLASLAR